MAIKTRQEEPVAINLTPMIDVLFLLIIFFMAGTRFVELERQFLVDVPRVEQADDSHSQRCQKVIHIDQGGEIHLEGEVVTPAQLTAGLLQARRAWPNLTVLVRGDAQGRLQSVADVLSACQQAGIADLAIAVRLDQRTLR